MGERRQDSTGKGKATRADTKGRARDAGMGQEEELGADDTPGSRLSDSVHVYLCSQQRVWQNAKSILPIPPERTRYRLPGRHYHMNLAFRQTLD